MPDQIFVNLPVQDLKRSMEFFSAMGFTFNEKFTDEKAACLVIKENSIYAMLLTTAFFKQFTKKDIADAHKTTEVLIALNAASRQEVNDLVDKALASGGTSYSEPMDHGWMYQRNFADPDGHQWEILFMDESMMNKQT